MLKSKDDILNSHDAVALYFEAPSCSVCGAVLPKLDELFRSRFPKIEFIRVDISKEQELAAEFGVFSAATIAVFFDKKEFVRRSRVFAMEQLSSEISRIYDKYFS